MSIQPTNSNQTADCYPLTGNAQECCSAQLDPTKMDAKKYREVFTRCVEAFYFRQAVYQVAMRR